MPALVRVLLALQIAACVSLATAATAVACTCAIQSEQEAWERADVVLVGVIVDRDDRAIGLPVISTGDPITYTVRVEEVLKGDVNDQAEVARARSSASCGLEMSVGQRWRLYANGATSSRSASAPAASCWQVQYLHLKEIGTPRLAWSSCWRSSSR